MADDRRLLRNVLIVMAIVEALAMVPIVWKILD
jgi:hypothetical protein